MKERGRMWMTPPGKILLLEDSEDHPGSTSPCSVPPTESINSQVERQERDAKSGLMGVGEAWWIDNRSFGAEGVRHSGGSAQGREV
jgi:hypothetical protein